MGIGIIIATSIMATQKEILSLSKKEIETQAYSYGMRYPSEMKVTESGGVGK